MEMEQILHMNGGEGKLSYATNSLHHSTVISMVKPILEETIMELHCNIFPDAECLTMVDSGCSSGPTSLLVLKQIINTIHASCRKLNREPPSLQLFLNDLPGNDFNTVFKSLPSFYKNLEEGGNCFIAGMPASFYTKLFPNKSLHFVHSSYALMWLSEEPRGLMDKKTGEAMNKENIYIAKTSPPSVFKAYFEQFEQDFTLFLRYRSEELICGGRMLLTTMGSVKSDDPLSIWELIGLSLNDMVLEGLVEKTKLESFNLPYYAATVEEVKKVIEKEGSFNVERFEAFEMDWDAFITKLDYSMDKKSRSTILAKLMRSVSEPLLSNHFGKSLVMDDLFGRFQDTVLDHMVKEKCKFVNLVICLTKKG